MSDFAQMSGFESLQFVEAVTVFLRQLGGGINQL